MPWGIQRSMDNYVITCSCNLIEMVAKVALAPKVASAPKVVKPIKVRAAGVMSPAMIPTQPAKDEAPLPPPPLPPPPKRKRTRPTAKEMSTSTKPVAGRDGRAMVEDPVLTTVASRADVSSTPLNLCLRVKTMYKSVAGSRRQVVETERGHVPLSCEHLLSWAQSFRQLPSRKTVLSSSSAPAAASASAAGNSTNHEVEKKKGKKKSTATTATTTAATATEAVHGGGVTTLGGSYPVVHREQWMVVPEFLSEELWERHQYSMTDIRKTLDAFPPRVLWQLVISYNKSATNASSRICSDSDLRMTFGGKSTAISKLLIILKKLHPEWVDRPSVTWNMHKSDDPNGDHQVYDLAERHVPGLPVHRVKRETFEQLLTNLVYWPAANIMNRSLQNSNITSAPTIDSALADSYFITSAFAASAASANAAPSSTVGKMQISVTTKIAKAIFSWRGIKVVPLEINEANDLLLVARVVPWNIYVATHGLPESLRTCPNFILAPDGYFALLDECFYFYATKDPLLSAAAAAAAAVPLLHPKRMDSGGFAIPAPKAPKNKRSKPSLFSSSDES